MNIVNFLNQEFKSIDFNNKEIENFFSNLLVKKKEINERDFKKKLPNIIKIVHLFANDPLIDQEDVLKKLDVSKNELIEINLLIRWNKN